MTNATAIRHAVFLRASAVIPAGYSAWALAREVTYPTINTTDLPSIQVSLGTERHTPEGDANTGDIKFFSDPTVNIVILRGLDDPSVLDGQADMDLGAILDALFDDNTFTNPNLQQPQGFVFEACSGIETRRGPVQNLETYVLQLSISLTFEYRTQYSPPAPNWLEQVEISTEIGNSGPIHMAELNMGEIHYSVTGPTSGSVGVASGTFTLALERGATFTGDQSIIISDSGAGGAFTPSIGSPGVGSVVVTPINLATGFSFTYGAAAPGPVTIAFADKQNWVDPPAISFLAS
jgi:hypothetical protein